MFLTYLLNIKVTLSVIKQSFHKWCPGITVVHPPSGDCQGLCGRLFVVYPNSLWGLLVKNQSFVILYANVLHDCGRLFGVYDA